MGIDRHMTRRQQIIVLLELQPWSAYALANYFRVEVAEIFDDLEHIKYSIRPRKFKIIPALCKHCGFEFKDRVKLKAPTKCPRCKGESLTDAHISIV